MCGIAGWYDGSLDLREAQGILTEMSASMSRRGPDSSGEYIEPQIALLHRRLAVIDIENGKQPMTIRIGQEEYTIVYNGELYNTAELRAELTELGHRFRTKSDTEAVLAAYIQWKEECVYHLNGIYAFAVWEKNKQQLYLARDRVGVKPLFIYRYDNGILFASQIGTLLKNPLVAPRVDEQGLCELFLMGPGRTPGQGVYKGIGELLPGEYAVYSDNRLKRSRYFYLQAHEHNSDVQKSTEEVRELLTDAIERQLVSDVPLFTFLSGGLDSSIISYIAAKNYQNRGLSPLHTFSVDYTDNSKYFQKSIFQPTPDSDFIHTMADYIRSDHHNVVLENYDVYKALLNAVDARDLPGMVDVDSSLLLFCREIKKHFTVGLSGECADELFGGYPWYHNKSILFDDNFPWARSLEIRRSILKKDFLPRGEEYVRQRYLDTCRNTEKLRSDSRLEARMREMFSLNYYWFMQTLLDRKDRMSMYSGLEVRVPFCDHRIVDYAYNLPWSIKALNGREKGILRAGFRGLLPDSIIDRKKSPYPKTHNPLYFELCALKVMAILEDTTSPLYPILDRQGVEAIIQEPEKISSPWYGQLMKAPQILAYLIQLDYWFRRNNVSIVS